jgi:putative ABC transport system permease protein
VKVGRVVQVVVDGPLRDLRHALRQLAHAPGFTVVALLTLALGIGASTAIFSVLNSVLLRPLRYPDSDRLVVIRETWLPRFAELPVSPGHYFDWRAQASSFESLAALQLADGIPGRPGSYNLTGSGEPVRVSAARVTANTFATLGTPPALGRGLAPGDDRPGHDQVVVLSHGFWLRQLGGRRDVLGQTLRFDDRPFTVVGVLPRDFALDRPFDVYTPAGFTAGEQSNRGGGHVLDVIGRLKPGVSIAQARGELQRIAARIAAQDPATSQGWGVKVTSLLEATVAGARPVLLALLGAVALLLLMACANVANLLLARAAARERELAIRAALGADRARIVRQLLTESVLLATLGGLLGVLIARVGLGALLALAPEGVPRAGEIAVDLRALGFACLLALATGITFGLAPVLRAAGIDLGEALKDGGHGAGDSRRQSLRGALVVAEVAIALVLLVGAGLLVRSVARLLQIDPGFRARGAFAVSLSLPSRRYATPARQAAFADDAIARLAALPGVQSVGATAALPFSDDVINLIAFRVAERPLAGGWPTTYAFQVTPDYLPALGVPLLRGRLFDGRDVAAGAPVALINQAMARKLFGGEDPIGRHIDAVRGGGPDQWREIVGVVGDVKQDRLDADAPLQAYAPFAQAPWPAMTFVVRAPSAPATLPAALRAAIAAVDPDQTITRIRRLDELLSRALARQQLAMWLFAIFSGAALLLAAVGIYGVMAYTVGQRTGELALRLALGAQARDVIGLVLAQGVRLIALGVAAGLAGASLFTRVLASLLFGVEAGDALTFAAVATLLALVGGAACLLPARRATKIDPTAALRAT